MQVSVYCSFSGTTPSNTFPTASGYCYEFNSLSCEFTLALCSRAQSCDTIVSDSRSNQRPSLVGHSCSTEVLSCTWTIRLKERICLSEGTVPNHLLKRFVSLTVWTAAGESSQVDWWKSHTENKTYTEQLLRSRTHLFVFLSERIFY